jgi:hypothetical protein
MRRFVRRNPEGSGLLTETCGSAYQFHSHKDRLGFDFSTSMNIQ